jgi:hypothetical protein
VSRDRVVGTGLEGLAIARGEGRVAFITPRIIKVEGISTDGE